MTLRRPAAFLPRLLVLAAIGLAPAAARADDARPYRPVPAEVGAALVPPPDLVAAARQLHAAAGARDAEAVFAQVAAKVSLITSGISLGARRRVEALGPWPDAAAALADIGAAFQEGELPPGGRTDAAAEARAQAFEAIATATENPEWGRDPLVKGGYCTYRGLRWDAAAGARIDAGSGGLHAPAVARVHASATAGAAEIGRLEPGRIYLQGDMDDLPEDWRAVRLSTGRVGAVRDAQVRAPATVGLCFVRQGAGGWRVTAFSSVLL